MQHEAHIERAREEEGRSVTARMAASHGRNQIMTNPEATGERERGGYIMAEGGPRGEGAHSEADSSSWCFLPLALVPLLHSFRVRNDSSGVGRPQIGHSVTTEVQSLLA